MLLSFQNFLPRSLKYQYRKSNLKRTTHKKKTHHKTRKAPKKEDPKKEDPIQKICVGEVRCFFERRRESLAGWGRPGRGGGPTQMGPIA